MAAITFAGNASFSIADSDISGTANISASKVQHQHRQVYSQPNTTSTTETRIIHVVNGASATITSFSAGSIVANVGGATVTVDLKKNGSSVLTSVITLNSSTVAYTPTLATLSTTTATTNDVFTIVITATVGGGTLATGVYASLNIYEQYGT
jgi:hypothetical protein